MGGERLRIRRVREMGGDRQIERDRQADKNSQKWREKLRQRDSEREETIRDGVSPLTQLLDGRAWLW